jgi:hypothetical protein
MPRGRKKRDVQLRSEMPAAVSEKAPEPTPQPTVQEGPKSSRSPVGPRRTGGQNALLAENLDLEAKAVGKEDGPNLTEAQMSERDKVMERYNDMRGYNKEQETETEEETPAEEVEEGAESQGEAQEEEQEEQPDDGGDRVSALEEKVTAAERRMHEATQEAANYRKFIDEISSKVDLPKIMGESLANMTKPSEGVETTGTNGPVEYPSIDLLVSNPTGFYKQLQEAQLNDPGYVSKFAQKVVPNVAQHNDIARIATQFHEDYKESGRDTAILEPVMVRIMQSKKQANPDMPVMELYTSSKEDFEKAVGIKIKTKQERKSFGLESPTKRSDASPTKPQEDERFGTITKEYTKGRNKEYLDFRKTQLQKLRAPA